MNRSKLNQIQQAKMWMEEKRLWVLDNNFSESMKLTFQEKMDDWYVNGLKNNFFDKKELDKIFIQPLLMEEQCDLDTI